MKFKKFLILGFLLIALVALPVSFAADISVTDLNPNYDGGTDLSLEKVNQSISSTSIEEDVDAFDTSNLLDNETIYLNGSYTGSEEKGTLENPYKNINNATKALLNSNKTNLFIANGNYIINNHFNVTDKNINIIGESGSEVKINCNKDYLFAFTNSNSNIYNLIITNGYSNSDYAIIWTELSNITMCNVVFTNNLANSPGGIILARGGNFKLINSSIKIILLIMVMEVFLEELYIVNAILS